MGATTLPETSESGPPVAVRSSEGLSIGPCLPAPYYADHAVTIAERVVFMATGEHPVHEGDRQEVAGEIH